MLIQDVIVGVPVAETVQVAALVPHETQIGLPVAGVCNPYPEAHVVIVTVPLAKTVQVAALFPHETQLGLPLVGVCNPYVLWHAVTVRLTVKEDPHVAALGGHWKQPTCDVPTAIAVYPVGHVTAVTTPLVNVHPVA